MLNEEYTPEYNIPLSIAFRNYFKNPTAANKKKFEEIFSVGLSSWYPIPSPKEIRSHINFLTKHYKKPESESAMYTSIIEYLNRHEISPVVFFGTEYPKINKILTAAKKKKAAIRQQKEKRKADAASEYKKMAAQYNKIFKSNIEKSPKPLKYATGYLPLVKTLPKEIIKDVPKSVLPALAAIKKNCKQILAVYKKNPGQFFYHGSVNRKNVLWYRGTRGPNSERETKDTTVRQHELGIFGMKQAGFIAHRGNSLFVTGDISTASEYAAGGNLAAAEPYSIDDYGDDPGANEYSNFEQLYIIFPTDNFYYTWSPKVSDFYNDIAEDSILWGFDEFIEQGKTPISIGKQILKLGYTNKNIDKALKSKNEVMICSAYYAINIRFKEQIKLIVSKS